MGVASSGLSRVVVLVSDGLSEELCGHHGDLAGAPPGDSVSCRVSFSAVPCILSESSDGVTLPLSCSLSVILPPCQA